MLKRVIVTLCDAAYQDRALVTIKDLRTRGCYSGDLVIILVSSRSSSSASVSYSSDFEMKLFEMQCSTVMFPRVDTSLFQKEVKERPFLIATNDGREYKKLAQFEKLHIFHDYFKQWDRVLFLDAGVRVMHPVQSFWDLESDCKGHFLAMDDSWNNPSKTLGEQLNKDAHHFPRFVEEFGESCLTKRSLLNAAFMFDTQAMPPKMYREMLLLVNKYPIWRTNEMIIMNVMLQHKYNLWRPFPVESPREECRYLFEWSDLNRAGTCASDYVALKYPAL